METNNAMNELQRPAQSFRPWARLHAALMPDYNRQATVYWWTMVALGTIAIAYALLRVAALPFVVQGQVVVGAALAVIAGFFPVRIRSSRNSFVAGEIFIFLLLLMHGAPAATLAAAGEAFVGSYRSSKRWTSRLFSPPSSALAMTIAGTTLELVLDLLRVRGLLNPGTLLFSAMVASVLYFLANTVSVSMVLTFKRGLRFSAREHLDNFGSIGIAYAGNASVAALLEIAVENTGISVLLGALPVIAMLLTTVHFFFRQQEADERMRRNRIEAAEREAEQMARHVNALKESEQRFHSAFTHASIGMALVSLEGRVLQANEALAELLGEPSDQGLVQRPFSEHVLDADVPLLEEQFGRILSRSMETFEIELRCRRHDGGEIWIAANCGFFSEPGSDAPCLILQVQDISARRHAEAQLNQIAFHDGLTGLPNRGRFHTLLAQALAASKVEPGRHFAVMFLDFDRFKLINDSMGHSAGDEFLVQVSRRIQDSVRPGDVVARLGGDEFAVLAHDVAEVDQATSLAERLQAVLKKPLQISGVNVTTSASIGITFSALGYSRPEEMLRDADIAMYRAKTSGKARHALFDAALHTQLSQRVQLEADLRHAIATGQLAVAYQPLFRLDTGTLTGFEALARWDHPVLGPISPGTFIPIAEECGLIVELTDFMLTRSCAQLRAWQLRDERLRDLRVQVNVSSNDLAHAGLAARVERALHAAGVEPRRLTLELTENILMQRVEGSIATLQGLRQLGVGLAIDDFGTGYSSLSYLSRLPIDVLKIDRSFVNGMSKGTGDSEIVRAIVSLGATLGKAVVAEGIESETQLGQLRELGCASGQGFHLSRPLRPDEVERLLDCVLAEPPRVPRIGETFVASAIMPLVRH